MARKISLNMYMTLDGYGEFPSYPGSDIQQKQPDISFEEMWVKRYQSVDTIIYGRNSYVGHAGFHALSARKDSDPEFLFNFSRFLEGCKKIVLSHTLTEATWGNSRILQGNLTDIVESLRNEPGKDIIVDAGPSLARDFISGNLADDYRILVFPVILGKGHHYWENFSEQVTLRLVSAIPLEYGELYLHYQKV